MAGLTIEQAKAMGYCITSRRGTLATRIDRADWREHMATKHAQGERWVKLIGDLAADQYRRVYSQDTIRIRPEWIGQLPNSGVGPTEFMQITE